MALSELINKPKIEIFRISVSYWIDRYNIFLTDDTISYPSALKI